MSNNQEWNESSEELWYSSEAPEKSDRLVFIYRILVVVLIIGILLILPGFPLENSTIFVLFLEFFSCLIVIYSFIHWKIIFNGKRKATP